MGAHATTVFQPPLCMSDTFIVSVPSLNPLKLVQQMEVGLLRPAPANSRSGLMLILQDSFQKDLRILVLLEPADRKALQVSVEQHPLELRAPKRPKAEGSAPTWQSSIPTSREYSALLHASYKAAGGFIVQKIYPFRCQLRAENFTPTPMFSENVVPSEIR